MPKKFKILPKTDKKCIVCGEPRWNEKSKYCKDCSKIYHRMRNKGYPPEAVQGIWDFIREHGKVCFYTRMKLDLDNPQSPRYLVFDHWIPNDPHKIVPTSALINTMKSELLEDEFWDAVFQLADYKRLGKPVDIKDPVHWYRLHPPEQ